MRRLLGRFVREEDGTETVEWGIMAGLLVTGLVGVVAAIGVWVHTKMGGLSADLGAATPE